MKNRSNKQSGQTILEVIIAMAIITITITGVASLTLNIVNYGYDSEARSLAVNIAQETLDTIKNVRDNDTCGFFSLSYGTSDTTDNIGFVHDIAITQSSAFGMAGTYYLW